MCCQCEGSEKLCQIGGFNTSLYALSVGSNFDCVLGASLLRGKSRQAIIKYWLWNGPHVQRSVVGTRASEQIDQRFVAGNTMHLVGDTSSQISPEIIPVRNIPAIKDSVFPCIDRCPFAYSLTFSALIKSLANNGYH